MSAVSDEQEWRDGFYLGTADHRQHRPHADEHGRPPRHREGYEDGWVYDTHVEAERRQDWRALVDGQLAPTDTPPEAVL